MFIEWYLILFFKRIIKFSFFIRLDSLGLDYRL